MSLTMFKIKSKVVPIPKNQYLKYCSVKHCKNASGTMKTCRFYRSPPFGSEYRAQWDRALQKDENINQTYSLCSLHFRDEDIQKPSKVLKKGSIPIPVPVLKEEILEESSTENIEKIYVDAITDESSTQNMCESCNYYDEQLQAAHAKIALLEAKVETLTEQLRNTKHQPLDETFAANSDSPLSKQCITSQSSIQPSTAASTIRDVSKLVQNGFKCFKCGTCGMAFGTAKELGLHMQNGHKSKKLSILQCPVCQKMYTTADEFRTHMQTHSKNIDDGDKCDTGSLSGPMQQDFKFFKCAQCNLAFGLPGELADHFREEHEKTNTCFQCYLCKIEFDNISETKEHMKLHERTNKCAICRMRLTLNELNSHLCDNIKSIRCEYCQDKFTATSKLLDHLNKSHEQRKFYNCDGCPKYFPMIALKEYHMKANGHDAPKLFACNVCPKTFRCKITLNKHMKCHSMTSERSHLCEICGKCFQTITNLQVHMLSYAHNPDPKNEIQCPDCPKKFLRIANFKRHSQIHKDIKYVCKICQKELSSYETYRKHLRLHEERTRERKFSCQLCPLKFFNAKSLKKHQNVHTGARLFNCRFCSQTYKYSGDLNKHLRTHYGDNNVYECAKCPKRFQYQTELQKHEFEHYKAEKEAKIETN